VGKRFRLLQCLFARQLFRPQASAGKILEIEIARGLPLDVDFVAAPDRGQIDQWACILRGLTDLILWFSDTTPASLGRGISCDRNLAAGMIVGRHIAYAVASRREFR
jgi:hypothetical protein